MLVGSGRSCGWANADCQELSKNRITAFVSFQSILFVGWSIRLHTHPRGISLLSDDLCNGCIVQSSTKSTQNWLAGCSSGWQHCHLFRGSFLIIVELTLRLNGHRLRTCKLSILPLKVLFSANGLRERLRQPG